MLAPETEGTSSLLIFLATASVTTLSWFFFFPHIPTLNIPFLFKSPRISHSKSTSRTIITNLLLLHTLFILHRIILLAPPNLFARLGLSLGTPTDAIRSLLLVASPDGTLPERVEMLLKRLGSAEMRVMYVKFGHETLSACDFCSTYFDFALYALTGVFLEYLREAAVIGLITIKYTSLEWYRSVAIGVFIVAAAGEAYWLATVGVAIPREGNSNPVMWFDVLTLLRQLLFLFLPLIIHFILPPSPPRITQEVLNSYNPTVANPSSSRLQLPPAITTMHDLINRLQLLRYTRGAFGRIGSSSTQDSWWTREREMGAWVREDEEVKRLAKGLGMDYQQTSGGGGDGDGENAEVKVGELRANTRRAVATLFRGFVPSGYWTVPPQR